MTPASLAAEGLPVFPCRADKRPACPRSFKDATRDPVGVRDLFARHSGPLIGVPTGAVSGIDVLDLDMDAGADEWLSEFCTNLPATRTHNTRSGGYHLVFRHRDGLRNTASKIAPGVDTRADGGYVIWWPATGSRVTHAATLADWPGWLLEAMTPPRPSLPPAEPQKPPSDAYVAGALLRACRNVREAGEGCRNDTLNNETLALSRFVATGDLSAMAIAEAMARAALDAGLASREVEKTIASALKARRAA